MHSLIYICGSTPLYSLSLFLPSIIQGMGFTDLRAQAMSAPPYAIGKFSFIYSVIRNTHIPTVSLYIYYLGRYAC